LGNRGGPLAPLRRRAPPPLPFLPDYRRFKAQASPGSVKHVRSLTENTWPAKASALIMLTRKETGIFNASHFTARTLLLFPESELGSDWN